MQYCSIMRMPFDAGGRIIWAYDTRDYITQMLCGERDTRPDIEEEFIDSWDRDVEFDFNSRDMDDDVCSFDDSNNGPQISNYTRDIINNILGDGIREELHHQDEAFIHTPNYTLILAQQYKESEKAVNLRVFLDKSAYKFEFPFNPSLFIWVPKSMSVHIKDNCWEVHNKILNNNLNNALQYLQKSLIEKFNCDTNDVYNNVNEIHLYTYNSNNVV